MSDVPATARPSVTVPGLDEVWPDHGRAASPRLLLGATVTGVLASFALPGHHLGLGALLVLLALVTVAAGAVRTRISVYAVGCGAVCVALCAMVVLRDAWWIVALCVSAAFGLGAVALGGARTVTGVLVSAAALPVAWLRGVPWVWKGVAAVVPDRPGSLVPVARTVLVTTVLVTAFGWLFASADAVFAQWTDRLLPDPSLGMVGWRVLAFASVVPLALAVAFLAGVPPRADRLAPRPARTVRRFEWAVPVALVDAVFLAFLAAQLTTLFGGHDYLRRTTGLTYAEYVHQGFGQLTVATVLTIIVVTVTARKAGRRRRGDRVPLRVLLGVLCMLTFVVVGSALYRMYLYEQAYGFTQMRLLVTTFEAWLGVLVALLLVAGVRLAGSWLPRAAATSGAVALLALAVLDPDAYVAERNVERFERTGRIDWVYLHTLSADAVPALDRLPEPYRSCALRGIAPVPGDDLFGWNLGRSRARQILQARPVDPTAPCASLPIG